MPKITIRVSEHDLKEIQDGAQRLNLTTSQYMLHKTLPGYLTNVLTVDKVFDVLDSIPKDTIFSLKDIFTGSYTTEFWYDFTPGSRISTGRIFYQLYDKNTDSLQSKIVFLGKNNKNLAIYKKL